MLSNKQKNHLRALAHARKPIVTIGSKGLTETVLNEADAALTHHELVKIKVSIDDRESRGRIVTAICDRTNALLIQQLGKVATLYRRNPEQRKINLPE